MNVQHSQITEENFNFAQDAIKKLADYFSNRVVGQNDLKHSLIASIIEYRSLHLSPISFSVSSQSSVGSSSRICSKVII